jgi:hypothetical protein
MSRRGTGSGTRRRAGISTGRGTAGYSRRLAGSSTRAGTRSSTGYSTRRTTRYSTRGGTGSGTRGRAGSGARGCTWASTGSGAAGYSRLLAGSSTRAGTRSSSSTGRSTGRGRLLKTARRVVVPRQFTLRIPFRPGTKSFHCSEDTRCVLTLRLLEDCTSLFRCGWYPVHYSGDALLLMLKLREELMKVAGRGLVSSIRIFLETQMSLPRHFTLRGPFRPGTKSFHCSEDTRCLLTLRLLED